MAKSGKGVRTGAPRKRRPSRPQAAGPGSTPDLDREAILAVIDEIDFLEMALETVPTLTQLAQMMASVQHCADPKDRDEIARLGLRRRGIDVDYDKGMTALRPCGDGLILDAATAPEMIVEAVRWRLQRISAALCHRPRRPRAPSTRPSDPTKARSVPHNATRSIAPTARQ